MDKSSQDVLVIPFGPTIGESVGLLSEQKVCIHISIYRFIVYCLFTLYVFNIKKLCFMCYSSYKIIYCLASKDVFSLQIRFIIIL